MTIKDIMQFMMGYLIIEKVILQIVLIIMLKESEMIDLILYL